MAVAWGFGQHDGCGVASMIIVGSQADRLEASAAGAIACCGPRDDGQNRIERSLAWLGQRFSVRTNPGGSNQTYLYYMYAMERVGRLAGRRFFADPRGVPIDWYREGVKVLIAQQRENGSFGTTSHGNDFSEVAFALLFLAKGKRQVVINRLDYGGQDWNHHPLATQHLVAHTEQAWKRDLAWQTVRLAQARVEDLLEAPVLFISGSQAPNFSREDKLLLKRYVEQGGFVFAEACQGDGCRGAEFERYWQELVVELFDQPLEKLPPDHPIWYAQTRVDPRELPADAWLYGVQSCCRLGLVYVPYSLSCRWELNLPYGNRPEYAAPLQADINTATKIGINVLTYATGKELKEKLDTVSLLEEVAQSTPTQRGLFVLPTLMHNVGADDAPRAAKTLVEWLNRENPFQMSSEKRLVAIHPEELAQYPLLFMHGRGKLELNERQREALRQHFEAGGFLLCNAICADEAFANSFRARGRRYWGKALRPLDAQHPIFSQRYYGFDIRQLSMIDPPAAVAS